MAVIRECRIWKKLYHVNYFDSLQGGAMSPKVLLQKNSEILAHSAIWSTPFVLGAYITGIILAENVNFA
jgi:hypothetical protein